MTDRLEELLAEVSGRDGVRVREPMNKHTTFRIGGRVEEPDGAAEHAAVALREALLAGDATLFSPPRFEWHGEEASKCG